MSTKTALFLNESVLREWTKKNSLKFTCACFCGRSGDEIRKGESFCLDMRRDGKKVMILRDYIEGEDWFLAFH